METSTSVYARRIIIGAKRVMVYMYQQHLMADCFESVDNPSYCTIIEFIVVNNFSSGFPPSTKTSPFRPKMSVNAETTQDHTTFLFKGNETRRVSGTNTRSTVLDRLAVEGVSKRIHPLKRKWRVLLLENPG
jgi:hypothetical protein